MPFDSGIMVGNLTIIMAASGKKSRLADCIANGDELARLKRGDVGDCPFSSKEMLAWQQTLKWQLYA